MSKPLDMTAIMRQVAAEAGMNAHCASKHHTARSAESWCKLAKPTKEQVASYLKRRGQGCLFCGSDSVTGDAVDIEEGSAVQGVDCADCNAHWTDVYTLTDVGDDADG